jgi:hypothetical protein
MLFGMHMKKTEMGMNVRKVAKYLIKVRPQ